MKKDLKELNAIYDARKSFYSKAMIYDEKGAKYLLSYNTVVARINNGEFEINSKIKKNYLYSNTTLRHIKEFYYQFIGYKKMKKDEFYKFEKEF